MFIDFRERGRWGRVGKEERERERQRYPLVTSRTHADQGLKPQSLMYGVMLQPTETPSQGCK